jgi:hypothetical protein
MKKLRFGLFFFSTLLLIAETAFAQTSGANTPQSWSSGVVACPVPEPGVLWLLLVGLVAVVVAVALKKRKTRKEGHSFPLDG